MSNTECTVTIADIYGAEWWERNKAELDREWEWGFRLAQDSERYAIRLTDGIVENKMGSGCLPRIILHRRKPKPPTLREVYGVDEVTIPVGWEWTREWRVPVFNDCYIVTNQSCVTQWLIVESLVSPRLILRERQKKVWFKAEAEKRPAMWKEWVWDDRVNEWAQMTWGSTKSYLCATRHEEIDQTVQVVTQAMVDEGVKV